MLVQSNSGFLNNITTKEYFNLRKYLKTQGCVKYYLRFPRISNILHWIEFGIVFAINLFSANHVDLSVSFIITVQYSTVEMTAKKQQFLKQSSENQYLTY